MALIKNHKEYLKCILARDLLKGKIPDAEIPEILYDFMDFAFHLAVLDYHIAEYEQEVFNSVAPAR